MGLIGLSKKNDLLPITSAKRMEPAEYILMGSWFWYTKIKDSLHPQHNTDIAPVSHVILYVTILPKVMNDWQIADGFKNWRSQVITFFCFVFNILELTLHVWKWLFTDCTSIKNKLRANTLYRTHV